MAGPRPRLKHIREHIVDADGRVVILHGLNIMNKGGQINTIGNASANPEQGYQWFSFFYLKPEESDVTLGEQWAQFFVEHGFNAARVGIFWNSIEPEPGRYDDTYIQKIVDMVQIFSKYHIFTVLDFHQDGWFVGDALNANGDPYAGFPRWAINPSLISSDPILNGIEQTCPRPDQDQEKAYLCNRFPYDVAFNAVLMATWTNFWHNTPAPGDTIGLQDRYLAMYAHIIPYFRDEPYLLSFASGNEMNPDFDTIRCLNLPSYGPTDTAVPAIDPDALLRCSVFHEALYPAFKERFNIMLRSLDTTHMIQHDLTILEISGMLPILAKPMDPNTLVGRPSYNATKPVNAYLIDTTKEKAAAINAGCIVTEFGSYVDSIEELPKIIRLFDKLQLSWFYWNFRSTELSEPVSGNLLLNPALPPHGTNIDQARLAILVEPYPQAIAGTPLEYYHNPVTRIFTMSYSSERADGCGTVSASLLTEIVVPRSNYPNGYNIDVSGASVVSAHDSALLLLKRNESAKIVTVTVASR